MSIIPKKDKDLRQLKNWRPLSLLNTDYKIITKLLAKRLQNVIGKLISTDQNGYIRRRFIGDNIRTISDIIEYTSINNPSGIIALIDFEKTFDTVNLSFLQSTLSAFGFGENFINWINILYTDINSCCMNNGHASAFFKLSRGIRQGCPISALLFILVAETLAITLRSSGTVQGLTINGEIFKISQLADDTTLFLRNTCSLNAAFVVLDKYYAGAGLKLNRAKT